MTRSLFIAAASGLGLGIVALSYALRRKLRAHETLTQKTRSFRFKYVCEVTKIEQSARTLDLWIPLPQDDEAQLITGLKVEGVPRNYYQITSEPVYGNKMLHVCLTEPARLPESLQVTVTFDVVRRETSSHPNLRGQRAGPAVLLGGDSKAPITVEVTSRALAAVNAVPAERGAVGMARALYDRTLADMKYDKSGTGWGQGDVEHACSVGAGNCSDFHSLFIAMSRAAKIPAVYEIGFSIPTDAPSGPICGCGYHCWAWYHDDKRRATWRPVDISEASKALDKAQQTGGGLHGFAKAEYFFGNLCENRCAMTMGRDIVLAPPQRGPPLNFFIHPYAEVDGDPGRCVVKKSATYQSPTCVVLGFPLYLMPA